MTSLALLLLNIAVVCTFAILATFPSTRPRALRFFRSFFWLWIIAGALFSIACGFTPGTALQLLTGTIIPMIQGIIPLIASATAIVDPAEATAITNAQNVAENALTAIQPALKEYESNPNNTTLAAVQDGIDTAHDQLNNLMTAAQVKNAKTKAKITAIVNAAFGSLAVLESMLLQKHPQTVAAAQAANAS